MVRRAFKGGSVPFDQIVAAFPIARAGLPEDVAAACAFFVSDEAGYISSQILGVNGGAG
jgi:NAD(P)-dependent dehydrogenase (short-subunit alcohol dehydrogenase family)